MIKFLLCSVVALFALCSTVYAQSVEVTPRSSPPIAASSGSTVWIGVAVSRNGRVFELRDQMNEQIAKAIVKNNCEATSGWSCQSIAVPTHWDVVAVSCNNGTLGGFVQGSQMGLAEAGAYDKALRGGYYHHQCRVVHRY